MFCREEKPNDLEDFCVSKEKYKKGKRDKNCRILSH